MKRVLGTVAAIACLGVVAPAAALPSGDPVPVDTWSVTDGVYPHDSSLNLASGGPGSPMKLSVPASRVVDLNAFYVRTKPSAGVVQFVWTSPHGFRAFPHWDLSVKMSTGDGTVSVDVSRDGSYQTGAFWRSTTAVSAHRCIGITSSVSGGTALINVPTTCFGRAVYFTLLPSLGSSTIVTYALTTDIPNPPTPAGPAYARDDVRITGRFPTIWVGYPAP